MKLAKLIMIIILVCTSAFSVAAHWDHPPIRKYEHNNFQPQPNIRYDSTFGVPTYDNPGYSYAELEAFQGRRYNANIIISNNRGFFSQTGPRVFYTRDPRFYRDYRIYNLPPKEITRGYHGRYRADLVS